MDMEKNGIGGAVQAANILDNAIALSVEFRRLGTRRKLQPGAVQTDADQECIHVSKDILESEAYEDIKRLDGDIRNYIERKSVRAKSLFRAGVVFIKTEAVPEIDAALKIYAEQRESLVNRFMFDYEPARERARGRLRSQFDEDDYPDAAKVRASFAMKVNYLEFGTVPAKLKSISADIYRREVAKVQGDIARATEEIRMVLRASLQDLTEHLIERLTPKADGSAKVFRNSLVGNVQEFLDTFNARNITGDAQLEALVNQAREALKGVNPDMLRDRSLLQEKVRENFQTIKATLDGMMQDSGRRFDFSE